VLYQLLSVSQAVEGERQLAGRVKSCRGAQQRDVPKQGWGGGSTQSGQVSIEAYLRDLRR
jgi:hypothetical protein